MIAQQIIKHPQILINASQESISTANINFGYIEDNEDPKDLMFSTSPLASTTVADEISLKKYFKEISNQYQLSSCVSNATADAFEAQQAHRQQVDPSQIKDLSRLFIYWNARNLETPPATDTDGGTRIRLAFDTVARFGVPSEETWAYDIKMFKTRPSIKAYREAIVNRFSAFYRIDGTDDDRVTQIIQALNSGNPVVFGTKVGEQFRTINSDIVVDLPNDSIGNHAIVIVGWSATRNAFEIRNSWGTNWGVNGYCWLSANYIKSSYTKDLWVPTV